MKADELEALFRDRSPDQPALVRFVGHPNQRFEVIEVRDGYADIASRWCSHLKVPADLLDPWFHRGLQPASSCDQRETGVGWGKQSRAAGEPMVSDSNLLTADPDAHQRYKLIEAVGRFIAAGADVIELPQGRKALVIPDEVVGLVTLDR